MSSVSSDSDDDNYRFYGKALEPYDEDAFPKKRPVTVEEQIATDAQGRRRFHGAFTGGFSAGFFNTVGSLEGWTPAEFKSSRSDKAETRERRPEDYMDEEDVGEFGIAPQVVRAKEEFATKKKRKKRVFGDGPIPGEPVLETLLSSGNETVGYLLLRNMGLKQKDEADEDTEKSSGKVYGCEMPKVQEINKPYEVPQYRIPDIYQEYLKKPKSNTFGLGYSGLDKSHLNLFESTNLVVKERNNKKLSISGQAFGVGAFEDEDEDIYTKDNMNKYDFELTSEAAAAKKETRDERETVFGLFKLSQQKLKVGEFFPPPTIPHSFSGKHKVKKSRFEPIPEEKPAAVERKSIDPNIRAKYLGEETNTSFTRSDEQHKTVANKPETTKPSVEEEKEQPSKFDVLGGFNLLKDRFVSGGQEEEKDILVPVKKCENLHGTKEMRDAAAMKMFGPLTRITFDWQPCTLLCKRFNVPEPNSGETNQKTRKRTKHLIFEYQQDTEETLHQPGLTVQKKDTEIKINEVPEEAHDAVVLTEPSQETEVPTHTVDVNTPISSVLPTEATPVIDLTERIDIAKNTDLFKAIFLSSSESEGEEEEKEEVENSNRTELLKNNVLTDNLVPKIKTRKEGILSNLDFSQFTSKPPEVVPESGNSEVVETGNVSKTPVESKDSSNDLLYGPKIPQKIINNATNVNNFRVEESLDYEWVEKDDEKKSSHKHKKKNKKDKYEHKKKHKRKHEKKKR